MSTFDGTSNPVKSYPAASYKRMGLDVYPNPYFDPSSWYTPPTIKEMFRWCLFLYLTNSTIGPVIRKKASYVITDLTFSAPDQGTENIYREIFEKTLKIKRFEFLMLLDLEVYGNAFASILYPFDRYLVCPSCKKENLIRTVKWEYDGKRFRAKCKGCGADTHMEIKDVPVRNRKRLKLQRWNPMYIEPRRNPVSGKVSYILRIPKWLRQRIADPKINKTYVEDTPKSFLDAVRDDMNIELDPENIYHMKYDSISMEDDSMGIPPILNIMKDVWLLQTYRKGQESIALDHILPLTLVSPQPAPGSVSPHMNVDLGSWRARMNSIISAWRRDPNALFPVPFPITVSQVRGDAAALSLHNDINFLRQSVAGGLDVPADFIYGNLQYSGGNVSLRVLENLLINRISQCEEFITEWLAPKIRAFYRLGDCKIKHKDFKMADDIQQKQIAMNLRQTGTISDKTVMEELDFDFEKEQRQKAKEDDDRITRMKKEQIAQAEIEAEVMVIRARGQARAQAVQQQILAETMPQQPMDAEGQPQAQPGEQPGTQPQGKQQALQESPSVTEMRAEHFMKSVSPEGQDFALANLHQTNPVLASVIEMRRKRMMEGSKALQPLPEQKPPVRSPETAVI